MFSGFCKSVAIQTLVLAGILASTGCQSTETKTQSTVNLNPTMKMEIPQEGVQKTKPLSNTDPCAMKMHDLCGPLLLYCLTHNDLPKKLEDLRTVAGFEKLDLKCPESNKPYLYNPIGVQTNQEQARVIIYDPEPSHSGMRWAITFQEPQGNQPAQTRVVGLPEGYFNLQVPRDLKKP